MAGSLLKPLLLAGSLALLLAGLVPSPSLPADAPETAAPYWVFLRAADDSQGSRPLALSERAVRRLGKMGCTAGSDPRDRAVSWQVLAPLRERGVRIRTLSRWFHAATALLTPAERSVLERDLRVAGLQPVRRFVRPFEPEQTGSLPLEIRIGEPSEGWPWPGEWGRPPAARSLPARPPDRRDPDPADLSLSDYGPSWDALELLGIPEMHRRGYGGDGVLVALFDTGFRWSHDSLASRNLIAQRDFVCGDDDVQWDPGDRCDYQSQNFHGTATWSVLGGWDPGHLVGAALRASFVLARTEDLVREVQMEEDSYIAALEWVDSLGVDIVSTSLGYRYFDDGSSHSIDELDGETLLITRATEIAAERGMLVVAAIGNDGPDPSTLLAPADGKRVVSVGATDVAGTPMPFSARGPTGDGRIKPDVSTRGIFVDCADFMTADGYAVMNGTSIATPLVGGLATLLLEARPWWTPDSLAAALRRSGDRANQPRNDLGWGVPDGLRAISDRISRLRIVRADWQSARERSRPTDGSQSGRVILWIRNGGLSPSSPGRLWIGPHSQALVLADSSAVTVPALRPGRADSVGVSVQIVGEPLPEWERFFVQIETPEGIYDRRVTLALVEAYELGRFEASLDPSGAVRIVWEIVVDEPYQDLFPPSVRLVRIDPQGVQTLIHEEVPAASGEWIDSPAGFGRFQYWLELTLQAGFFRTAEGPREVTIAPVSVELAHPYPNPIGRGMLTISLLWPGGSVPALGVFDMSGRRVVSLSGTSTDGGSYDLFWDLKDRSGRPVASGLYILRLGGLPGTRVLVVR